MICKISQYLVDKYLIRYPYMIQRSFADRALLIRKKGEECEESQLKKPIYVGTVTVLLFFVLT